MHLRACWQYEKAWRDEKQKADKHGREPDVCNITWTGNGAAPIKPGMKIAGPLRLPPPSHDDAAKLENTLPADVDRGDEEQSSETKCGKEEYVAADGPGNSFAERGGEQGGAEQSLEEKKACEKAPEALLSIPDQEEVEVREFGKEQCSERMGKRKEAEANPGGKESLTPAGEAGEAELSISDVNQGGVHAGAEEGRPEQAVKVEKTKEVPDPEQGAKREVAEESELVQATEEEADDVPEHKRRDMPKEKQNAEQAGHPAKKAKVAWKTIPSAESKHSHSCWLDAKVLCS